MLKEYNNEGFILILIRWTESSWHRYSPVWKLTSGILFIIYNLEKNIQREIGGFSLSNIPAYFI